MGRGKGGTKSGAHLFQLGKQQQQRCAAGATRQVWGGEKKNKLSALLLLLLLQREIVRLFHCEENFFSGLQPLIHPLAALLLRQENASRLSAQVVAHISQPTG